FEHVHGEHVFDYLARHPEAGSRFDAAMTSRSRLEDRAIVAAYDFPRGTIADIGGGRGSLMAAILARHPGCRGIVFDQSHVLEDAGGILRAAGVADRCRLEAGSFFEGVPAGADILLMKKIIHDWDDARAGAILAN